MSQEPSRILRVSASLKQAEADDLKAAYKRHGAPWLALCDKYGVTVETLSGSIVLPGHHVEPFSPDHSGSVR